MEDASEGVDQLFAVGLSAVVFAPTALAVVYMGVAA
jgi:hypothetical protein